MTARYPAVTALRQAGHPAAVVCELLGVCRSAYYADLAEPISSRKSGDEMLKPLVKEIFDEHKRRYGARRISKALAAREVVCGPRRVARLMKELELTAIQPRSFRPQTTQSRHGYEYSPNLLLEYEGPTDINQLWVGDITYIGLNPTGFAYAALLMDRYSRRVVGWNIDSHMREELVQEALTRALNAREPLPGLMHHTDRGGQYAGNKYRKTLRNFKIVQSMSRAANCYDNAFMESCFGTIKREIEVARYPSVAVAKQKLESFICYYNTRRIHSKLGYVTPLDFEQQAKKASRAV